MSDSTRAIFNSPKFCNVFDSLPQKSRAKQGKQFSKKSPQIGHVPREPGKMRFSEIRAATDNLIILLPFDAVWRLNKDRQDKSLSGSSSQVFVPSFDCWKYWTSFFVLASVDYIPDSLSLDASVKSHSAETPWPWAPS